MDIDQWKKGQGTPKHYVRNNLQGYLTQPILTAKLLNSNGTDVEARMRKCDGTGIMLNSCGLEDSGYKSNKVNLNRLGRTSGSQQSGLNPGLMMQSHCLGQNDYLPKDVSSTGEHSNPVLFCLTLDSVPVQDPAKSGGFTVLVL